MSTTIISPFLSDTIETEYVEGADARYAYRRFGKKGAVPLVFCMRFRGTMDHWDPALLDLLAGQREVIAFDNIGTASSTGASPTSFQGFADGAAQFIEALGLSEVDMLGWSMGGYVAQIVALDRPGLVRRRGRAGQVGAEPSPPAPRPAGPARRRRCP